jgi:hypothetical protein
MARLRSLRAVVLDRGEAEQLADLVGADAAAMTAEDWPV